MSPQAQSYRVTPTAEFLETGWSSSRRHDPGEEPDRTPQEPGGAQRTREDRSGQLSHGRRRVSRAVRTDRRVPPVPRLSLQPPASSSGVNSQARAGTGSRRGNTAPRCMLTTGTFHLHRSRLHSPPSRHTAGGGRGSRGSGTGTQSSGTSRGGLERMIIYCYSICSLPPRTPLPRQGCAIKTPRPVRASGTCRLSWLLVPRGSKQSVPLEAPALRGSPHTYTQPRRCRPHNLSARHSATRQARIGLRRHRTTAWSHSEASRVHSPERTVTQSAKPALRAQDGVLGGRKSLAYKIMLESLLQGGQRSPKTQKNIFSRYLREEV